MEACHHNVAVAMKPRNKVPSPRRLVVDLNARDGYTELNNFEMEVSNIFLRHYEIRDVEKYQ